MKKEAKIRLDPVTFEVIRGSFDYIPARMSNIQQKSAFSPFIYDQVDFSVSVYNSTPELTGQTANCPVHLAAMQFSVQAGIKKFGKENLHEEDVIVLNDPYSGGTHTPDVTFTKPIFYKGELIGFGCARCHWTDVGGGGPGAQAFGTHIASEGFRLPPLKIVEEGKLNRDIVDIMKNASRCPQYILGDINASQGALRAAEQEYHRLADKYGMDTLKTGMEDLLNYTETITRNAISDLPQGEYEAEDFADTDGVKDDPVYVRVKLIVKGDEITIDLTGSDRQVMGAINSPIANTYSAVYYSLQFFLAPHVPANGGMFRPIKIILPDDCWLNPKWPAPTIGCTTTASSKITAAIWQALAKCIPKRITGCTFGECNWFVTAITPGHGSTYVFTELVSGGWGGTPYHDGMSVTQDPLGNCKNMSAEIGELLFPLTYDRFELRTDSGGPGRYRGGLGMMLQITPLGDMYYSHETSRTRIGAPGANGGGRSLVQRYFKGKKTGVEVIAGYGEDGKWRRCIFGNYPFKLGENMLALSTGGGGYGDPLDRPPEEVLEDVLDEYVSIMGAERDYGVVIDPQTLEVDYEATKSLREKLRASPDFQKHIFGVRFDYIPVKPIRFQIHDEIGQVY